MVSDDPLVVVELAAVQGLALGRRDGVEDLHRVEEPLSVVVRQASDLAPVKRKTNNSSVWRVRPCLFVRDKLSRLFYKLRRS